MQKPIFNLWVQLLSQNQFSNCKAKFVLPHEMWSFIFSNLLFSVSSETHGTRLFSSIFSSQLSCGRTPGLPAAECWLFAASARAALRPVRAIAGAVAGQVHLLLLRRLSAEQHEENQQESLEYFIVKENTCVTIILWLVRCALICEY